LLLRHYVKRNFTVSACGATSPGRQSPHRTYRRPTVFDCRCVWPSWMTASPNFAEIEPSCGDRYWFHLPSPGLVPSPIRRSAAAHLPGQGSSDRERCGIAGPHPHAGGVSAGHGTGQAGAIPERVGPRADCKTNSRSFGRGTGDIICGRDAVFLRECGRGGPRDHQEIYRKPEGDDDDQGFKITAPTEP